MFKFLNSTDEQFQKEILKNEPDLKKIEKFLEKGIDLNRKDDKGRTILYPLVAKRKVDVVKLLLDRGIDINSEDIYGKTVLNECIDKNDGLMIRFLLDHGASINHKNSSNRTIIQDVALSGDFRTFQILNGYKPDFNIKDGYGKTVLFDAVEGGNENIVKEVVNNIENINVLDENGETVLFRAVLKEDPTIAKVLILNGIDVNIVNPDGQNALFNAVLLGVKNVDVIKLFIKKGVNLNVMDKYGKTLLDELLYILELQKENLKDLEGKYRLINETREYLKIAIVLIENGLNIDKIHEDDGLTTLAKEIASKNYDNVKFLLDCGANVNITDEEGYSILYKEILKGYSNYRMIDYLIQYGADINKKNEDEKSIVDELIEIMLIQNGYKKGTTKQILEIRNDERYDLLFKKILSYYPDLNYKRKDGKTVLFDTVLYNDFELIKTLINYGMNPNEIDNDGNTPLSYLVEEGLKINENDKKEKELFHERLVFFLKFRINVDIQDKQGRTVFHKAVIANDLAVVEKLLTKKANLALKDIHGRTALHHTQWNGNYKIARWLMAAGADMNQPDNSGFTLLNYAVVFGHTKLVIALIASGVLMYNRYPKSQKVAKFLKSKEENMQQLLNANITDIKMKSSLQEAVENTRNEINEALRG